MIMQEVVTEDRTFTFHQHQQNPIQLFLYLTTKRLSAQPFIVVAEPSNLFARYLPFCRTRNADAIYYRNNKKSDVQSTPELK